MTGPSGIPCQKHWKILNLTVVKKEPAARALWRLLWVSADGYLYKLIEKIKSCQSEVSQVNQANGCEVITI